MLIGPLCTNSARGPKIPHDRTMLNVFLKNAFCKKNLKNKSATLRRTYPNEFASVRMQQEEFLQKDIVADIFVTTPRQQWFAMDGLTRSLVATGASRLKPLPQATCSCRDGSAQTFSSRDMRSYFYRRQYSRRRRTTVIMQKKMAKLCFEWIHVAFAHPPKKKAAQHSSAKGTRHAAGQTVKKAWWEDSQPMHIGLLSSLGITQTYCL